MTNMPAKLDLRSPAGKTLIAGDSRPREKPLYSGRERPRAWLPPFAFPRIEAPPPPPRVRGVPSLDPAMPEDPLEILRKTAALARLDLDEAQAGVLSRDLEVILAHFRVLAAVDVEGVEPTTGATVLQDVARPDVPRPSLSPLDALGGAPDRRGEHYALPETLEGES